ncbi:hypothetical protein JTE90_001904 [Oedothorax gibbosus]|uniref:Cuticle protein n=1 Tax=Oedothorax gibbosus TaxID=931172 RepID=A0AAV6VVC8_9ARAC|nr:hypothetical protein JTE90_001904 [Oedothorax gibbosus]
MILFLLLAVLVAQVSALNHEAQPYEFGYAIKDKHGQQHREETSSGPGSVKGSYGFTDERGLHRVVEYVADHNGFRAHVKTNEPGTMKQNPAAVEFQSSNNKIPHITNFASVPNFGSIPHLSKASFDSEMNNAGFGNGFNLMNEFNFPAALNNAEVGEEMFHHGYGLGDGFVNAMDGLNNGADYGDLPEIGAGFNGLSGNLNGYFGNNVQGFGGMHANNLFYGGHLKQGYNLKSSNPTVFSSNGKYQTNLVGGNVKGYDSRYSLLKRNSL